MPALSHSPRAVTGSTTEKPGGAPKCDTSALAFTRSALLHKGSWLSGEDRRRSLEQALEVLGFWLSGSAAVLDNLLWQGRAA